LWRVREQTSVPMDYRGNQRRPVTLSIGTTNDTLPVENGGVGVASTHKSQ